MEKNYFPFPLEISFYYCFASKCAFLEICYFISSDFIKITVNKIFSGAVGYTVGCGFPVKAVIFHVYYLEKKVTCHSSF